MIGISGEFDPMNLVVNSAKLIANKLDHEEKLIKFLKTDQKRSKPIISVH